MTEIPFQVDPAARPGDAPLEYGPPRGGRVRLTVRLGRRRTGGHSIRVTRITRDGALLMIGCDVRAPGSGEVVTQVLTAPAETISVDAELVRGVSTVTLVDQNGALVARVSA